VSDEPKVHRFPAKAEGAFVNAYLVQTGSGVIAVDGLLTVSAAKVLGAPDLRGLLADGSGRERASSLTSVSIAA
jgi:hypothetical protein